MFTSHPFPQIIHFSFPLSVTAAFSSVLLVVVFAFPCHMWRQEARTTGKYWILFYPLGMWSNWFLLLRVAEMGDLLLFALLEAYWLSASLGIPCCIKGIRSSYWENVHFLHVKVVSSKISLKDHCYWLLLFSRKAAFLLSGCTDWCGWIWLFYHLRTDVVKKVVLSFKDFIIFLMIKWFPLKYHWKIIATGYFSQDR